MILISITCKDRKEAEKISRHLIDKKMIACASISPVRSIYRWKGRIVNSKESMIMAKSLKNKSNDIIREVKKMHSYKIPLIEIIESKVNKDYEMWAEKELRYSNKKENKKQKEGRKKR